MFVKNTESQPSLGFWPISNLDAKKIRMPTQFLERNFLIDQKFTNAKLIVTVEKKNTNETKFSMMGKAKLSFFQFWKVSQIVCFRWGLKCFCSPKGTCNLARDLKKTFLARKFLLPAFFAGYFSFLQLSFSFHSYVSRSWRRTSCLKIAWKWWRPKKTLRQKI